MAMTSFLRDTTPDPVPSVDPTIRADAEATVLRRLAARKGKVHQLFDKEGADAAWTLGIKLKLAEGTLRSWFGTWRREAAKPKETKVKKPTKAKVNTAQAVAA
jgi:hypothetical protein